MKLRTGLLVSLVLALIVSCGVVSFAVVQSARQDARESFARRAPADTAVDAVAMPQAPQAEAAPSLTPFGWFRVVCTDETGAELWTESGPNMVHNEGEQYILQAAFSEEQAVPANFYIGLDARASLAEDDVLTDLSNEHSGDGYARQPVYSSDTAITVALDSGDYKATFAEVTFTASGGTWTTAKNLFVTTVVSGTAGKLIASRALSQDRIVADGESLDVQYWLKISE